MSEVARIRDEISLLWHEKAPEWNNATNYSFATMDQYFAFCASKDWLQDTCDVLMNHRRKGFSENSFDAYLEFWGVLQAIFVQQDAIEELHYSVFARRLGKIKTPAWKKVRDFRNWAGGHPVNKGMGKDQPLRRSVSGREAKTYERIELVVFDGSAVSSQTICLGKLMDEYDLEAAILMENIRQKLSQQLDFGNE